MAKRGTGPAALIDVPVKFGNQSANKQSASIGISIDREHADPMTAAAYFCAKSLTVELWIGDGLQRRLPGTDDTPDPIEATFDAKSFGCKLNEITTRFVGTHSLATRLAEFAGKSGRLLIKKVDDAPEKADDGEGDAEE
jgi:hypothetical protein